MKSFIIEKLNAKLRYHDFPGKDIPIVFIHGLGCASSCDYPRVAYDELLKNNRKILIDLPGSGFSDKPQDFGYQVEDHAKIINDFFVKNDLRKVHLFGHSMGGAIAIVTAAISGNRISTLTLSEPNLDPGGGFFSRLIGRQQEEDYISRGHEEMIRSCYEEGNDTWAASLSNSLPAAIYRESHSLIIGNSPTWREQLLRLNIPRTVIFGEKSLPDPDVDRLSESGINIKIIKNAGHSMAWENPEGLACAISETIK